MTQTTTGIDAGIPDAAAMRPEEATAASAPRRRARLPASPLLILLLLLLLLVLVAPSLAPHDAGAVVSRAVFAGPSWRFPLGTDYLGRDVLSRVLIGTRYTVFVALAATLLACAVGVSLGIAVAVVGGWLELVISRICDTLISIPSLLFGLMLVAAFGSSLIVLMLTMAAIYMPGCYRITRALALRISALDYVQVARGRGESLGYIVFREILPNVQGPVRTDFGLRFVYVVLLLSNLSFLGLGVQPPDADLGSLVRENILGIVFAASSVLVPALAIAVLTVGVNLLLDRPAKEAGGGR